MNRRNHGLVFLVALTSASSLLGACSSDASAPTDEPDRSSDGILDAGGGTADVGKVTVPGEVYPLKVRTTGLRGSVTLQNNGADVLTLSPTTTSGSFPNLVPDGSAYDITVKTQPGSPRQTCTVAGGKGTMGARTATVSVDCLGPFKVSGFATSSNGVKGLVIQDDLGEAVSSDAIDGDGVFTFAKERAPGDTYSVTVKAQPTDPWQTCLIDLGGSGTIGSKDADVRISCELNKYKVKGTYTGLESEIELLVTFVGGGTMALVHPGGSTSFEFPLPSNSAYAISVSKQPTSPAQNCVVSNGTGKVTNADVSGVSVVCQTRSFPIKLQAKDLPAGGLVVQNGSDVRTINADGDYDFPTPVKSGSSYAVSLVTAPAGGTNCKFYGATSGTVGTTAPVVLYGCGKPKRAFKTLMNWNGGDLGGLAGADAKCQSEASNAGISGTYKAWLSDDSGSPSTRFTRAYEDYVLVDGTLVAHGYTGVTSGSLEHELDKTAANNGFGSQAIHTNTKADGTLFAATPCANWTSQATSAAKQSLGTTTSKDGSWTNQLNFNTCDYAASLYCFEQ